jgi:DNA helicase-2/ATP-dependent DNA helicase PcrA
MPKPTLQQYNEAFASVLEGLNAAQREAVEQIEGPVLVIAGPGTGKTHILSARIGRILLETDAQAHNILCLTFTDAGVQAMRERLLSFIGPEAHRVHIYTFHSFCNTIIQENLELFGRHDLEPLSDLERVELIRTLIDELDVHHPLKRIPSNPYFYERHLYDLFKKMKSEAWTPAHVAQEVDAYIQGLPEREGFFYKRKTGDRPKGSPRIEKIAEEEQRMKRLKAGAALYDTYQKALARARRYDYDDMILWVLDKFNANEAVLRRYQEQYLYLLVDEYQDTNGAQNNILQHLISYWESPNIFIVGDDDQSIYEFQGARLKNLSDFYTAYAETIRLVVLTENYRSTQHILDTAHQLIEVNERRIVQSLRDQGVEKMLRASNPEVAALDIHPTITKYPNRIQENAAIVRQLDALHQAGASLQKIAIIYARHRQVQQIQQMLQKKGIPFQTRRKVNILDEPVIQNLRQLLAYFGHETTLPYSGEHLLFKILHFSFWDVPPRDLARLSFHLLKMDRPVAVHWRDAIGNADLMASAGLEKPEQLKAVSAFLETILQDQTSMSLPRLIERVVNTSGLLSAVFAHQDRAWLLQVIKTFMDFVKEETDRNPRVSIPRLLSIMDKLDSNFLSIELQETIGNQEGVHLLTAHSSKGLEFEQVFIIDGVKDYWEPGKRGGASRFRLPDTLTFSNEEDDLEARRRLFFVAMTRAQQQLHISFSAKNAKGKDLERTQFIDEIVLQDTIEIEEKALDTEQLVAAQMLDLQETNQPVIDAANPVWIDEILEGFVLSVSAMNRFLKCPLSFYYEHILRVPTFVSESATYGQAMHNALQRLFEQREQDKDKQFAPPEALIRMFEQEMRRRRGFFSPESYDRRIELGRRHLKGYYETHYSTWTFRSKMEWPLRNIEVDGVPLTGVLDRVDYLDATTVQLIDYKTGALKKDRTQKPTKSKPYGGAYWRQLLFYKVLFEFAGATQAYVKQAAISFLELDDKGTFPEASYTFSAEDVRQMRSWIKEVHGKIKRHEFYEGCGEASCRWCNFARQNALPDSFSDREIEALDDRL